MKFETVSRVLRVYPFDNHPEIYILITPAACKWKKYRDFFLVNNDQGNPIHMFTLKTQNDTEAIELANANAIDHTPLNWLNKETEPVAPLRICWRCLAGLECREGPQSTTTIYWDEDDEEDAFLCDWCDSDMETELYELQ